MEVNQTNLHEVLILTPQVFEDERGFFVETYQMAEYATFGITAPFLQDNHSRSCQGTLRGLHYQIRQPQGKLVRVVFGKIFDVAVDIRRSSSNFGKWTGVYLSADTKQQLWIPPGFAHGFYVISDWAELVYKVTDYYAPQWERTILWNDPTLKITWPLLHGTNPLLSIKDARGKLISEAETFD